MSADTAPTNEIPKLYDPAAAQKEWSAFWERNGSFNAEPGTVGPDGQPKKPHTIMIPLPNVTGALHMGHALNGTCQDLVTRWKRMQGYEALWMPGTDHAGIATQAVVERRMQEEEGLTRHDIGRDALVTRIWKWKDAYEARIISQLKLLGFSCDWRRVRFTLDDVCSKAVRRTFFKMFQDGYIFRGKRLVNWDCFLQTAVADDEVYDEEIDGHFWTFNYPVVEDEASGRRESAVNAGDPAASHADSRETHVPRSLDVIRFSTTRPETMLGDTAVCVHPTDERYTHLIGKKVRIPVNGRLIPIIADPLLADKTLGTGCVKVTPAHDPNDYACWTRNKDKMGEPINILNPDGTINENGRSEASGRRESAVNAGDPTASHADSRETYVPRSLDFTGLDRLVAREHVIEEMKRLGHFEGVEDRKIPMKHSDRSKTPIEPYLSEQWFVKMDDWSDGRPGLAQTALDAVNDGRVKFFPMRYTKTYLDWLGEKRDWCISRQLWWGHRIPIWSKDLSAEEFRKNEVFYYAATESSGPPCVSLPQFGDAALATFTSGSEKGIDTGVRMLVCVKDGYRNVEQQLEASGFTQDPDVLDTWFSSALWPHATLGWPDAEHNPPLDAKEVAKQTAVAQRTPGADASGSQRSTLNAQRSTNEVLPTFYPGNVLVTSRDIITLWVARMVLTGLYNNDGKIPFEHVCVHPKILDGFGQTMSKSKGNGVDPLELVEKYGADAVRFTIASIAGETQDVRLPVGYECPHCSSVIPQTLEHQKAIPGGGAKPRVTCVNCKKSSQYTSPWFEPDEGEKVARIVAERFEYGRNFCNKLWNASRFAMLNLTDYTPGPVTADQLQLEDRWILSRLSTVANEMTEYLGRYQFDAATRAIRDFTWNEFCDWYLEMVKPRLRRSDKGQGASDKADSPLALGDLALGTSDEVRATAQRVLLFVLDSLVRLLQPFTPFICQELWSRLNEIAPTRCREPLSSDPQPSDPQPSTLNPQPVEPAAIVAAWPTIPRSWRDDALERRFARLQETIVAVRNVRSIYNIPPTTQLQLLIRASSEVAGEMNNVAAQFDNLAKAVLTAAGADVVRPSASAGFTLGDADGYIPLKGIIDPVAELSRQQKEADKIRKHIAGHEGKLANEAFVAKAPADVVAGIRETLAGLKNQLGSVEEIVKDLGG
ncbi:MAG: valine--tRNA ligase [Planctomycetota bacterium]|nr:MAG: valine--tRNA ligase [Planctomycetota bacterium]